MAALPDQLGQPEQAGQPVTDENIVCYILNSKLLNQDVGK